MLIRRKLLLAAASVTAICAGALPVASSADPIFNFGDVCKTASADANIGLPGSATSWGGSWATNPNDLCLRYVVDVTLPAGTAYRVSAGPVNSLTPTTCATLKESVVLYWKSVLSTEFSPFTTARFTGGWVNGTGCQLNWSSGDTNFVTDYSRVWYYGSTGSFLGGGVLRVAVAASTSEGPRMLNVSSSFPPIPN